VQYAECSGTQGSDGRHDHCRGIDRPVSLGTRVDWSLGSTDDERCEQRGYAPPFIPESGRAMEARWRWLVLLRSGRFGSGPVRGKPRTVEARW